MYYLIISIPLTTSIIILLLGRKIGIKGIKFISIINMIKILIISIVYLIKNMILPNKIIILLINTPLINKIFLNFQSKIKEIIDPILDYTQPEGLGIQRSRVGLKIGEWINIGQIEEKYKLEISKITIIMTTLIIIISFCVIIYSFWYLETDTHLNRFISYLLLFTTSMLILVNSSNMILLFLGWESVGITSYLLINYWYNNLNSNKSAIKAILYNKLGDISLLIFLFLLLLISPNTYFSPSLLSNNINTYITTFSIFEYPILSYQPIRLVGVGYNQEEILNLINYYDWFERIKNYLLLTLLFAIMAKSSQFFLHPWLGDAMAGPTPVSALLHAATMVTAGIYLMIRLEFLFNIPQITFNDSLSALWTDKIGLEMNINLNNENIKSNKIKIIYLIIGILTLFLGSLSSTTQYDIKKIIAFSTASQLAYMFIANCINLSNISYFHLITHGFFKALLFLTAGIIIHNILNLEQDIRKYGSLNYFLPFSSLLLLLSSFSLSSLPFLSGFYSKELIIQSTIIYKNPILFILLSFGAFLTFFYSIRLFNYTFISFPNFNTLTPLFLPIFSQPLNYQPLPALQAGNIGLRIVENDKIGKVERINIFNKNEIKKEYKIILIILVIGSITIGYILSEYFSSFYLFIFHFFNFHSIYLIYTTNLQNNNIFLFLFSLPLIFLILLSIFYILKILKYQNMQYFGIPKNWKFYNLFYLYPALSRIVKWYSQINKIFFLIFNRRIFIDTIINTFSNKFLSYFYIFFKTLDNGFIEFISPNSFFYSTQINQFSNINRKKFTNSFSLTFGLGIDNNQIEIFRDFFIYLLFSFSFILLLLFFY